MQSVVKVVLEVRSLPVRAPEVLVALVEQQPKQQSTVMQPVAPVESVVLSLVALATVVPVVLVAQR